MKKSSKTKGLTTGEYIRSKFYVILGKTAPNSKNLIKFLSNFNFKLSDFTN